jgi:tetratricopeptide (TPR) repeat protein
MPRFEIAKVYSEQGNVPRAIAAAKQGLEREPRSFYGWYTLGVVHLRAKQYPDAFRAFTEAVRLNARDGRAAANLADAAMRTSQLEIARQQFERMIQLRYRVAPAHYNLGLLDQRGGDTASARLHFQAALKADPAFGPAQDALSKLK